MSKTIAIIQARYQASRFPGKVLESIAGKSMLSHVIERTQAAAGIDAVWVATSTETADDAIAALCKAEGVPIFRGSETDVLDRYYQAAVAAQATTVLRITADCPLMAPRVIERVLQKFIEAEVDYATNTLPCTFPDGLDVEVFTFQALERAWREAKDPVAREHVTPFMKSTENFRIANVTHHVNSESRHWRWTVDTPEDMEYIRKIYQHLQDKGTAFGFTAVSELLTSNQTLRELQPQTRRDEGYYQSFAQEPPVPARMYSINQSLAWQSRSLKVIPTGTQTFSKNATQLIRDRSPIFVDRAQGCQVWDVDGNAYIDYMLALGPIVLGYNHPAVSEAVAEQLQKGSIFSLAHPLEVEVAELLTELIPCAEMVRFGKNGSDATAGAVRLARAVTGREHIACCGYHGWQDWYIGTTTRKDGVPRGTQELTHTFAYNDLESLETLFSRHPDSIAAVILEPTGLEKPQPGFLEGLRELCTRHQAALIFDEMITGFRLHLGGAQTYFKVTPDIACFGKAIANGLPLSAIVGKRAWMQSFEKIFFSFTFGGEALSLAAAKANIEYMRDHAVLDTTWDLGRRLQDGFNTFAAQLEIADKARCIGWPVRNVLYFEDESGRESLFYKSLFIQEVIKRGILCAGYHFICAAHNTAHIDQTLRVYRTALTILAEAIRDNTVEARLEGPPVEPVFRKA